MKWLYLALITLFVSCYMTDEGAITEIKRYDQISSGTIINKDYHAAYNTIRKHKRIHHSARWEIQITQIDDITKETLINELNISEKDWNDYQAGDYWKGNETPRYLIKIQKKNEKNETLYGEKVVGESFARRAKIGDYVWLDEIK